MSKTYCLNDVGRSKLPLGVPASYLDAVERSGGQCEFETKPSGAAHKPKRCQRYMNGGEKLYQWTDGRLYCETHYDKARREARKK